MMHFPHLNPVFNLITPIGIITVYTAEDHSILVKTKALAINGTIANPSERLIIFDDAFYHSLTTEQFIFITQHEIGHLVNNHVPTAFNSVLIEMVADHYSVTHSGIHPTIIRTFLQKMYDELLITTPSWIMRFNIRIERFYRMLALQTMAFVIDHGIPL